MGRLLPWLVLSVAPALLFLSRAGPEHSLVLYDVDYNYLALRVAYRTMLAHGQFWLWNPTVFGGMPMAADIQQAMFYPISWLLALVPQELLSLCLWYWLHATLLAVGTHHWLRELGYDRKVALLLGLLASVCGTSLTGQIQPGQIAVIAWLPWCAWAWERAMSRRFWLWTAVLALFLVLQLLAGFPQDVVYSLIGCGLYALARRPGRGLLALGLAGAAALALAAVQILPFLELARSTPRGMLAHPPLDLGSQGWRSALIFLVPLTRLGLPGLSLEDASYFGTVPLLLALWSRDRRWLALAALTFLLGLGSDGPLGPVAVAIPVYNRFRQPQRLMFVTSFFLTLAAARGWQRLADRLRPAVAAGILLEALLLAPRWMVDVPVPAHHRAEPPALAALHAGKLPEDRFFALPGAQALADIGLRYPWMQNVEGVNSLALTNWVQLLHLSQTGRPIDEESLVLMLRGSFALPITRMDSPILRMLNVSYAISGSPQRGLRVQRLERPLERAFVPDRVEVVTPAEQMQRLVDPAWKPEDTAFVQEAPDLPVAAGGESACRISAYDRDHVTVLTRCDRPKLLVLGDAYFKGWEVRRNGQPAPLLRCNLALRAVAVPAGECRLDFDYRPASLIRGARISLAALFAVLAALGLGLHQERKDSRSATPAGEPTS